MAFMTLEIIVFEKKQVITILPFFSFLFTCNLFLLMSKPMPHFYLLNVLFKEKAYTTFLGFEKGSIDNILRGQIWLCGFDSVRQF